MYKILIPIKTKNDSIDKNNNYNCQLKILCCYKHKNFPF